MFEDTQRLVAQVTRDRHAFERLTATYETLPTYAREDFIQLVKDLMSSSRDHVARRWLATYDR